MAAAERQPENAAPRMLLLRPRQRLAADVESCRAAGWQGVPFAPLEAQPLPDALAALPQQLAQSAAAFWVSPTAVEIAAPAAFSGSLKALPHVAVGAATAAALHAAGAQNVVFDPAGKDSESAARLPIWRTLPSGCRAGRCRSAPAFCAGVPLGAAGARLAAFSQPAAAGGMADRAAVRRCHARAAARRIGAERAILVILYPPRAHPPRPVRARNGARFLCRRPAGGVCRLWQPESPVRGSLKRFSGCFGQFGRLQAA